MEDKQPHTVEDYDSEFRVMYHFMQIFCRDPPRCTIIHGKVHFILFSFFGGGGGGGWEWLYLNHWCKYKHLKLQHIPLLVLWRNIFIRGVREGFSSPKGNISAAWQYKQHSWTSEEIYFFPFSRGQLDSVPVNKYRCFKITVGTLRFSGIFVVSTE